MIASDRRLVAVKRVADDFVGAATQPGMHCNNKKLYSITSSAVASSVWYRKPERPRRLEIEHEFEFGGPHHRQIARPHAFENTAGHALNCYSIFVITCAGSSAKFCKYGS